MAAVVASQVLLVPRRSEGGLTAQSLEEQQVVVVEALLGVLIEGKDPWRSMLDFCGEDCLSSVDQGERRFACRPRGSCAYGPEH